MKKMSLQAMIEASIFAAFALILDLLPSIKLGPWISISVAMVPIFILALRWGFRVSIVSGLLWGLLQVIVGDIYFLTPIQFAIEYFIAFAFVGFAGLLYPVIQKSIKTKNKSGTILWVIVAVLMGSIARYFWHFLAGVIFWGEYAPEGMSPVVYSLAVNGGTMLGAFILCSIVLVLLIATSPRLIERKEAFTLSSK
ncbi:energy-coupled thiamine transporter ThiT [Cytobacillus sp. S13-E01]|uniref:energy-coupled thiamine transporter ThiT n=1 Tax=Cytobacillus sp. S13-E01 TaxID=3031326 RepID=UPI0023D7DE09|nr:energy-coupled thiamine transporter ThiT [Cytobacillus sp. S13-E01]MDF0728170.1 energy-coupled thiamine transporter ThiT [Cytobacillus sp. S13-E01]